MKERLDVLLVKRGLAPSREKAKTIIMSGIVFVDNQREDKAGTFFKDDVNIEVVSVPHWSMRKKTDGLIPYGITDIRIHLLNGQHLRSLHQDRIADC